MDPNSELFRANQQVIYYRAEIVKYRNRILELERLVEKEKVRNNYLQQKIRVFNNEEIDSYLQEIKELQQKVLELEVELEEESTFQKLKRESSIKENKLDFYSYFNYSVVFPSESEENVCIYSHFTIVNTGDEPLNNIVICFKVNPIGAVILSGQISDPKLLQGPGMKREDIKWVYAVEDWRKKIIEQGEYWIKPVNSFNYNTLTLKGIEITINNSKRPIKGTIEAFIYFDATQPPSTSLNKINFQIP
ncbi:hypothetical protein [Sutcliffiella horikoshii]|uniref:hypothetical protein n=1 Tax=Sutcliffiella horikoshii TaxID=79883 RepID=UPI00384DF793